MSTVVTLEITSDDFRQNYVPEAALPKGARHWMLDFAPARDLLKAALMRREPGEDACLFSEKGANAKALDVKLNEMIDVLGMRTMAAPVGAFAAVRASAMCLGMMLRTSFSQRRG